MSPGLFYGLPRGVTTVWISRTIHNTLDRVPSADALTILHFPHHGFVLGLSHPVAPGTHRANLVHPDFCRSVD